MNDFKRHAQANLNTCSGRYIGRNVGRNENPTTRHDRDDVGILVSVVRPRKIDRIAMARYRRQHD